MKGAFFVEYVQNILNLAKINGFSNKQLCELLGKNPSYITDWKSGKSKPKADEIILLSNKFNVSIDTLLGQEKKQNTSIKLTAHEKKLIESYRKNTQMQSAVDKILGIEDLSQTKDVI